MSSQDTNSDDEMGAFSVVIANDLRHMSVENRVYAQKLINDILFLGKVGKISATTKILDGDHQLC